MFIGADAFVLLPHRKRELYACVVSCVFLGFGPSTEDIVVMILLLIVFTFHVTLSSNVLGLVVLVEHGMGLCKDECCPRLCNCLYVHATLN